MFDINKLQTTEIKSLNQISCQTFLVLQTVFTQKSRSAVILANITIAHHAHLTDFLSRDLGQYTATLCTWLLNSFHVSRMMDVAQKCKRQPCDDRLNFCDERCIPFLYMGLFIPCRNFLFSPSVGLTCYHIQHFWSYREV